MRRAIRMLARRLAMNYPWNILELDAATATEREVKAAYARLIKVHRPDLDPEGFQRVRGAYEEALRRLSASSDDQAAPEAAEDSLQSGSHGPPSLESDPQPIAQAPDRAATTRDDHLPGEWHCCAEALHHALENGSAADAADALDALHQWSRSLNVSAEILSETIRRYSRGRWQFLADHFGDALLVDLICGGEPGVVHEVLMVWQEREQRPRAVRFAEALEQCGVSPVDERCAVVFLETASNVALTRPDLAEALREAASPVLPASERDEKVRELERSIVIASAIHGLPAPIANFWRARLTRPGEWINWHGAEARSAIRYVVQYRGAAWSGLPMVRALVPPEVLRPFEKTLKEQAKTASGPKAREQGFDPARFLLLALFLFVLARCTSRVQKFFGGESAPGPPSRSATP